MSRDDYTPNVYAVTIPMVTHVTMRVYAHPDADTDELAGLAVDAWKRGDDAFTTGPAYPDYDDAKVEVLEDNNPEPEVNEDGPEDWDRDGPEAA